MKKIIFSSLLLLRSISPALACDICGCSIGNGFSTILPQFNKNFIGIRSSYSRYQLHHGNDAMPIHESSSATELWGRFYVGKKLQIIPVIPYVIKTRNEDNNSTRNIGLGDASLSINYTLINKGADSLKWKHLLLAGTGLKLPSGRTNLSAEQGSALLPLQPGSGSMDYLFNLTHTVRHNTFGVNNDLQVRYNTQNAAQYAFGNRYALTSRLFYWKNIRNLYNILPSAGVSIEKYDRDTKNGYAQSETGGQIISMSTGCELYYKNLMFNGSFFLPLKQHLGGGNLTALPKIQGNISFLF